jgi:hypothetical protein
MIFVSSRNDVGLPFNFFGSKVSDGLGVCGEEFSIAIAYAFDNVLNAVGDFRSISAFSAVEDFPRACGVVAGLI